MGHHNHRGKFITANQVTGQKGVNLIENIVLEMGNTWSPTSGAVDAEINGFIFGDASLKDGDPRRARIELDGLAKSEARDGKPRTSAPPCRVLTPEVRSHAVEVHPVLSQSEQPC